MKGAGSLAHEWMHALDHYLMLKSGTIKGDRTDEGRLTDPNFAELASEVSSWRFKSDNLNPDLLAAFKKLKDTAFYKEVAETQDEADAQEWVNRTSSRMDEELNKIRQYVANERKYGAKKAPATAMGRVEKRISSISETGILKKPAMMAMAVSIPATVSILMFFRPDIITSS